MSNKIVLRRRSNGRLYELSSNKNYSFIKLNNLLSEGASVKIICSKTKSDVTDVVIKQINNFFSEKEQETQEVNPTYFSKIFNKVKEKKVFEKNVNFIDLFCGAGGLSCGLEMAGLNCLLGVDIDNDAIKTFSQNHKNASTFLGSISDLTNDILKEKIGQNKIHVIAGGPPCQGFSTVGKGDPNDKKNSLFNHYIRILDLLKPDYLIFENVTGLLASKNEHILKTILTKFQELGYSVIVKILESQHYGVPQKRKRTILLGTRQRKALFFPEPIFDITKNGYYIPPVTIGDVINELKTPNGEIFNHDIEKSQITSEIIKARLKHIPEGKGIRYREDEERYLPENLRLNVKWDQINEGRLRELKFYRLGRNNPSPTINTQNSHFFHPTEIRKFTARELANFQSFPQDFIFLGKATSIRRQIGNAVPPLLGKALGVEIIKSLDSKDSDIINNVDINEVRKKAFNYDNFKGIKKRIIESHNKIQPDFTHRNFK